MKRRVRGSVIPNPHRCTCDHPDATGPCQYPHPGEAPPKCNTCGGRHLPSEAHSTHQTD